MRHFWGVASSVVYFLILLFTCGTLTQFCDQESERQDIMYIPTTPFSQTILLEDFSNIILSCKHKLTPRLVNFSWVTPHETFNNAMDEASNGIHVKLLVKSEYYETTLIIRNFSNHHIGSYSCLRNNIDYFISPDRTFILNRTTPEDIVLSSGEKVTFKCDSDFNANKRAWFRDGSLISERRNPDRKVFFIGEKLIIQNLQLNDSGIYTCRDEEYLRSIYRLTVIDEPGFHGNTLPKIAPNTSSVPTYVPDNADENPKEGEIYYIICHCANCWPLTSYSWVTPHGNFTLKDDNRLPNNFFIKQEVEEYTNENGREENIFRYHLAIKGIRKQDEGKYICILENVLGRETKETYVKVESPKSSPVPVLTFMGYKLVMDCHEESSTHEWISYYWKDSYDKNSRHSFTSRDEYRIFPVKEKDSKYNVCVRRAKDEEAVQTLFDLQVFSLEETIPFRKNTIAEGESVMIPCGTFGSTDHTWIHNSKLIEATTSNLTVNGQFSNTGLYQCSYLDPSGMERKEEMVLLVEPKDPPKLSGSLKPDKLMNARIEEQSRITVKRDFQMCSDFITIECRCLGSCFPVISNHWSIPESCSSKDVKEQLLLDENDDDGLIYNITIPVSNNCRGIFTCELENSKGRSQHQFEVDFDLPNVQEDADLDVCCPNKLGEDYPDRYTLHTSNTCGGW